MYIQGSGDLWQFFAGRDPQFAVNMANMRLHGGGLDLAHPGNVCDTVRLL